MTFQREKQNVTASDLLAAIAAGQDVQLTQCIITGVLDINRLFEPAEKFDTHNLTITEKPGCTVINLSQSIVFDKCTFEENAIFTSPWDRPDCLSVVFEADVIFNSSVFNSQARFRNSRFCGIAGFDGCSFSSFTTFKNTHFCKDAKFRTGVFGGYCLFNNAVFESTARFTNSHFVKGVNFTDVKFLSFTDFNGVYSSSRAVPACDQIVFAKSRYGDSESFWRFVKQSAQEAGYYHLAGEFFYNERCAGLWQKVRGVNYDSLPSSKKFLRWIFALRLLPEFVFGRLLFGYGERPVRVLFASAVVIIICAFLFSFDNALVGRIGPAKHSLLEGFYFSTITFTTLGYGDLYPAAEGFYRQLAMFEAVAGGCLMALFVVCLAKRFSRG